MSEKTQNQVVKWSKIVIEISILLLAVGIAWATLRGSVDENTSDIEQHDTRIKTVEKQQSEFKADMREFKVEQKYIRQGVDEIKESLK